MPGFLPILVLGFLLGGRHATDPDHVVAVTTIVSRERTLRSAVLIGALWGIGHTLTILLIGGAIILFRIVIPARIGLGLEFLVALMLMVLGAMNLRRRVKSVEGAGANLDEAHREAAEASALREAGPSFVRPLVVGIVHGLAGSAAIVLLVLSAITRPSWAIVYLFVFGLGTIASMMAMTMLIALPFASTANRFLVVHRHLGRVTNVCSLLLGAFIAYRVGIVHGLFTSHPIWTPE